MSLRWLDGWMDGRMEKKERKKEKRIEAKTTGRLHEYFSFMDSTFKYFRETGFLISTSNHKMDVQQLRRVTTTDISSKDQNIFALSIQ